MTIVLPLAVTVVLALLAGCTSNRGGAVGSGGPMGFCSAYSYYDSFKEPSPSKPHDVEIWATAFVRIINRVEPRIKIKKSETVTITVPKQVITNLKTMRTSLVRLRDDVKTAKDQQHVREALHQLGEDEQFQVADEAVTEFKVRSCP